MNEDLLNDLDTSQEYEDTNKAKLNMMMFHQNEGSSDTSSNEDQQTEQTPNSNLTPVFSRPVISSRKRQDDGYKRMREKKKKKLKLKLKLNKKLKLMKQNNYFSC